MKPAIRANNRNAALLDAAAERFSAQGFREATVRDIARDVGMLPGSIYYHYSSKDELLLAVYEAGVDAFIAHFLEAIEEVEDPYDRLAAAMVAHLEAINRSSPYMRVINRVLPEHVPKYTLELTALRDRYEQCVRDVVDDLPLAPGTDRSLLRLMILGALNHSQFWFDPDGERAPEEIGRAFAEFLTKPAVRRTQRANRQRGTHR